MKLTRSLVSGLAACGIMLVALSASAQTEQGTAKVVNIKGHARYMTSETPNWQPLKSGALLKPGTIIQTAEGSYVDLVLNNPRATAGMGTTVATVAYARPKAEQDAVRIFENSVLGIDQLTITQTGADKVTDTQLDLKAGRIFGTVKKMSAASRYEVKIPNGVAGIRGTIYSLTSTAVLSISSGSGVLAYAPDENARVQEVNAGQQYDAKTGTLIEMPESLLQELNRFGNDMRSGRVMVTPTDFAIDRTVFFVSPTTAQNGNNGGFLAASAER